MPICRYKQGSLPYVVYKQEILSANPFISIYYDVITEEQMDLLKNTANKAVGELYS